MFQADLFGKRVVRGAMLVMSLGLSGCSTTRLPEWTWPSRSVVAVVEEVVVEEEVCPVDAGAAEQARFFRQAATERAERLSREIERLQTDLRTAESALVEAESGLAGSHTRADAISSLAVTRIQVERAASGAPWRAREISAARGKLTEAEYQVSEGRFGAAIFFVYRARRVAEAVLAEADQVMHSAHARMIRAERVNLRAGPSTDERILSVLDSGTPVIPQTNQGDWMLVQVTGGPAGWVHRRLLGGLVRDSDAGPAAPRP